MLRVESVRRAAHALKTSGDVVCTKLPAQTQFTVNNSLCQTNIVKDSLVEIFIVSGCFFPAPAFLSLLCRLFIEVGQRSSENIKSKYTGG